MNQELFNLAADMLDLAADEFSNHGSNDWEWPEGLSVNARRALVRWHYKFNSGTEKAGDSEWDELQDDLAAIDKGSKWGPPDWCVMVTLADMLRGDGPR